MTQQVESEGIKAEATGCAGLKVLQFCDKPQADHSKDYYYLNFRYFRLAFKKSITTFEANLYKDKKDVWLSSITVMIHGHYVGSINFDHIPNFYILK